MDNSGAKPYGFFLDTISSYTNTPGGSVVIGETDAAGQKEINDSGRYFGLSSPFWNGSLPRETATPDAAKSWALIAAANKDNAIKNLNGVAKASAIINAALLYPDELNPSIRNEDPENWFYAQNFQIADATEAKENYALVTSVLWAARQLYPNTKIIPVFDSYYVKGLNLTPKTASEVSELTSTLGIPALTEFESQPPDDLGKQWNMISILHNSGLVDGWIGDIYGSGTPNDNNEGKLPTPGGMISPFKPSTSNPLPYALQSRSDYLDLKTDLPIKSDYYDPKEKMPFNASIDFNGDLTVPIGYSPSDKLTPTVKPYPVKSLAPIKTPHPESTDYVERLYNSFLDSHLLTSNENEIDILTASGWVNEGTIHSAPAIATTEVFRFYIPSESRHFYTALKSERDIIIDNQNTFSGWEYEGTAFSAYSTDDFPSEAIAVVRYLNEDTGSHVYSTSAYEQALLNESSDWINEGIAWYSNPIAADTEVSTKPLVENHSLDADVKTYMSDEDIYFQYTPIPILNGKPEPGILVFDTEIVAIGTDNEGNVISFICPQETHEIENNFISGSLKSEVEVGEVGGKIDLLTGEGVIYGDDLSWKFWGDIEVSGQAMSISKEDAAFIPIRDKSGSGGRITLNSIEKSAHGGGEIENVFSSYFVEGVQDNPAGIQKGPLQEKLIDAVNAFFPGFANGSTAIQWNIDLKAPTTVVGDEYLNIAHGLEMHYH